MTVFIITVLSHLLFSVSFAHTIDTCMIAGEILDLNVLIQSVISNNDDSMYRSFIPCNELERFGYDVSSIVTTAIQDSIASGFSLKSLVDVLKELEAPIDLRDKSSMCGMLILLTHLGHLIVLADLNLCQPIS